ncbi:tumor necrosis factor alpha-induced protein 2a isoform X2 [Trichomycterus rosablanca]|uniref:tumor necrosis factor alpha-induced protein 2a isoform X2 n=1 Tax=Trichomycterus rosablanca TaxID=2290929 RepID=UPI002F355B35
MLKNINLARNRGKKSKDKDKTLCSHSVCSDVVEKPKKCSFKENPVVKKLKLKLKILNIKDALRGAKILNPHDIQPELPVLDFKQNLEQNNLAEAGQQLLEQEQRLFSSCQSSDQQGNCTDDEKEKLQNNYEIFKLHLKLAITDSFNKENKDRLRSAVTAILQQEQQDKLWEDAANEDRPCWRPIRCRKQHDLQLQTLVEVRMEKASEKENGVDKLATPLKREVCRMGNRIQKDLLCVVQDVQQCYTTEFNICNMYSQLYHKAFSMKLLALTHSSVDLEDCVYILSWIHRYYPKDVLQQAELEPHINVKSLGSLLPEEQLASLHKQYLSHKQAEVKTWLSNALKKEEKSWETGNLELSEDGKHITYLAIDILPLLDGAMKEAVIILGNCESTKKILHQLGSFLESYKKSIDDLIKGKNSKICDILKASLYSIHLLSDYIIKAENLAYEDKEIWLNTLSDLKDLCHRYLLTPIHTELKEHYRKLWTQAWFAESQKLVGDLLKSLEDKIQRFSDIKHECMVELLNKLHLDVMVEYVRRMLKSNLKLKKDEQEAAAGFLCEDSIRIHTLFAEKGSKQLWLRGILPKVSEMLRLQDTEALKIEVVTLARNYPDIRWAVISRAAVFRFQQLRGGYQLCYNSGRMRTCAS